MRPTTIKDFRELTHAALERNGFKAWKYHQKMAAAWALPGDEVIPLFFPHEIRRPWGYHLSGAVGIELPPLTRWLRSQYAPEECGIFHWYFVNFHIANISDMANFRVLFGEDVPVQDWIGLVRERLDQVPQSLSHLIAAYDDAPDRLVGMDNPINAPAWNYLRRWHADPQSAGAPPAQLF